MTYNDVIWFLTHSLLLSFNHYEQIKISSLFSAGNWSSQDSSSCSMPPLWLCVFLYVTSTQYNCPYLGNLPKALNSSSRMTPIFSPSPIYIFFPSDWARERGGGLWWDLFLASPLKKETSNNHKQALIVLIYGAGLVSCLCIKVGGCMEINTGVRYPNFLIFSLFFFF